MPNNFHTNQKILANLHLKVHNYLLGCIHETEKSKHKEALEGTLFGIMFDLHTKAYHSTEMELMLKYGSTISCAIANSKQIEAKQETSRAQAQMHAHNTQIFISNLEIVFGITFPPNFLLKPVALLELSELYSLFLELFSIYELAKHKNKSVTFADILEQYYTYGCDSLFISYLQNTAILFEMELKQAKKKITK